jgi:hypothetical protein
VSTFLFQNYCCVDCPIVYLSNVSTYSSSIADADSSSIAYGDSSVIADADSSRATCDPSGVAVVSALPAASIFGVEVHESLFICTSVLAQEARGGNGGGETGTRSGPQGQLKGNVYKKAF